MKTIQDLYNEVIESDELKKEFLKAARNGNLVDFVKSHDCDASEDDLKVFTEAFNRDKRELSHEELENVAGGTCNKSTRNEALASVFSVGLVCGVVAAVSHDFSGEKEYEFEDTSGLLPGANRHKTVTLETVYMGQKRSTDGRLCNKLNGGSYI